MFAVPSNRPSFHTWRHLIVVLLWCVYLCLLVSDVWPLGGSFSGRKLVSRNLAFSWRLMWRFVFWAWYHVVYRRFRVTWLSWRS